MHVRVGGVWKLVNGLHVRVAGTWKAVNNAYVKVGGVWKQFYASFTLAFSSASYSANSGTSGEARLTFNSDGTIDRRQNGTTTQVGTWALPAGGITGLEQIRITSVSWLSGGAFSTAAAAENVWTNLSASPAWGVQDTASGAPGTKDVTFTVELRPTSGDAAVDSAACGLTADWEI